MMTSSEWELEMEYERRFTERKKHARLLAQDRKNLLKGMGWGLLIMSVLIGGSWAIINWIFA